MSKRVYKNPLGYFFRSTLIFYRANKSSCISFVALTLVYFLELEVFNYCLNFQGINYLSTHLRRFADSLVFALPILLMRKRLLVCIYSLIPSLYIIANIWYFRNYHSLIPISSFLMVENLNGLGPSILNSMRGIDSLLILPSLAFIVFYTLYGNKVPKRRFFTRVNLLIAPVFLIEVILLPTYIIHGGKDDIPYGMYNIDMPRAIRQFGITNFLIYTIHYSKPISKADMEAVDKYVKGLKNSQNDISIKSVPTGKNLIMIICESFQSWPINLVVDSLEITPNINRIISTDSSVIYFEKVLPQVKGGRSADAQLMINTGLLPIELGATSRLYGFNEFPSIPKALKKLGYNSASYICDNKSFWNQEVTSKSYGFDTLAHNMSKGNPWITADENLFKFGLEDIKRQKQPFYVQLVTISGHDPLEMNRMSKLKTIKHKNQDIINELVITEYVDSCIGGFIEGLKREGLYDNSIIVITGDHHNVTFDKFEGRDKTELSDMFVPLIVLNSPLKPESTDIVIGQIDIFPSILDMMGVRESQFRGLGHSIFKNHPASAVSNDGQILGNADDSTKQKLRNLWKISDILIRSDYFREDK